jgi:hypothetical protein
MTVQKSKKQTTIMWNHLDYSIQLKTIKLIKDFAENQLNKTMKIALEAALLELELWSNAPVESLLTINEESDEEENIEEQDIISKHWIH